MTKAERELLTQYRGPGVCEWCEHWVPLRECAHILGKGMGGGRTIHHPLNLISLCAAFCGDGCHHASHQGRSPTAEELWNRVSLREGVPVETIQEEINRLRKLKGPEIAAEVVLYRIARREQNR